MKRATLLISLLFLLSLSLSAELVQTGLGENSLSVLNSSGTETVLQYRINQFDKQKVEINGADWYRLSLPGEGVSQEQGEPELPVFNRSIIIPGADLMKLEVFDVQYLDLAISIAPSKGIITRDTDPATVPYIFGPIYQGKSFYPGKMAELSAPYILRDFRGITVKTTPFAYNPDTRTLRVYTSYKIRVYSAGLDTVNTLNRSNATASRDFLPIYEDHFVNWGSYRYTPVSDSYGKLLVICHTNYLSQIAPYVNWKKQKGIQTELVEFSTIGTTAAQLQTYIQNRYTADTSIAYVQLVGDAAQIPSLSSGGGGSDPSFSLVAGSDQYPDIFIGRFSAESTADVTAQVNKAIVYERDLNTSATWLTQALGISDSATTAGDDSETDITHMNNIRTKLMNYGYSSVDQVYEPSATAAQVTTNVNAGRGFINYVGHGSDTSWVTTGFSNSNASALTNGNKTPFIMDVACVNGNFVSLTCYAEAWMRNANGGSVAIYASSINQSWNSPMRAQDHFTDLLVAESKTTTGGLYYNASCNMMDVYGNTSGSDGVNMFKTWHIFGDASLMVRSKTPVAMSITHPANITSGTTLVNVSTGVNNTLVAITYNNTIYGRGFTNSSGNVAITLVSPPTGALTYTITATAFNRVTYVGSIAQTVSSGPWMEVSAANYDDNNNDLPEYDESGYLDVSFYNSGTSAATSVTATLSCSTTGITITDNTYGISSLAAGATEVADNAFAFTTANNISNGTVANFTITMVGSSTWTYNFSKTINAPALSFGVMTISDPSPGDADGKLDPGETVTISIPLMNSGAAASSSGTASLSCTTTGISVIGSSASFGAIAASGQTGLSYSVSASSGITVGTLAVLNFSATAGAYTAAKTENAEVGAATQITIGTGSSSQSYPLDRYYNYSSQEAIYLASEIGTAARIKSLAFYKVSGADVTAIDAVTIYMKNTTSTTLTTGTYSTTGYTQVFSGTFPNTATSGWMEVNLSSQFEYDGVSNLSILVLKGYQAWISSYPYWSYTTTSTARARQNRSDDALPTSLTQTTYLPNLRLMLYPVAGILYPPQNLAATATHAAVTLTWTAPVTGSPTGYNIYRDGTLLTTATGLSYTDHAVTDGITYSYYLKAAYSGGESSATSTVTATPNNITSVIIGTGTASTGTSIASPVSVYYQSLHGQAVYTAAELNAAGMVGPVNITQLGFNITALPTLTMPNFVVRMKHTSAANVASWIDNTSMTTVYTNASYLPTVTGYNMLTLATPFLWNGTDNLLIDTAFGLIGSYTSAGTVQYTSLTSGYRYTRSDTADQTNVFSGSGTNNTTSTYRPNVKLVFAAPATGPVISTNPVSISASAYEGEGGTLNLTINNTGNATLTWSTGATISTWGTVSPASGTIAAGGNTVISLGFSSTGLAIGTYNSNLVITSDATNNSSLSIPVSFTVNASPYPTDPRFVAEWEPATGAIIAYASGFGLPYNMIADLSTRGHVYVVVTSSSQSTASSLLSSNGVTMANVSFINPTGVNTYWTRDYGPWTIMDGNGEMGIVDFTYNRVRPYDDALNSLLDDQFGYNFYQLPLVATGGNVMTDGNGKMMSTSLILSENDGVQTAQVTEFSYTQSQIQSLVSNYLGAGEYQFYTDPLANSSIDHIDCFAKLLDVDKVIIARVSSTHSNYAAIEAVVDEWEAKTSSYGTPYQIFRVDQSSNNEPYTNSFIFNNKIYVPQWNSTPSSYDTAAIAVYQAAMPGYAVQGYYNSSWLSDDAVHCRVNTRFDEQMIHIWHQPVASAQALGTVSISAEITHHNPLSPTGTYVAYKYGSTGSWQYAPLSNGSGNTWTASVPAPALGQSIYYYLLATDNSSRTYQTPLCGAGDPFAVIVNIPPANQAPAIVLPESLSFDKNGSLVQDFSVYLSDPENDPLSLEVSGNVFITAQITGTQVSFAAQANWIGSEVLHFTVSDGYLSASDSLVVTVNPVNVPDWVPVSYGTTPAMLHAILTVNSMPCQVNDRVAAFVGEECRGTGVVNLLGRQNAYADFQLNLAASETVNFRIYSYLEDVVYPVQETLPMEPGVEYGSSEPVNLNGTFDLVLSAPSASLQTLSGSSRVVWSAVPHAEGYTVYACPEPFGTYTSVGSTTNLYWEIPLTANRMFYKVVATRNQLSRK